MSSNVSIKLYVHCLTVHDGPDGTYYSDDKFLTLDFRTSNLDVSDTTEYDGDYYKIVNYAGSYDSDTDSDTFHTALVSNGIFTCPLSGTYEFHFMGLSVSF